MRNTKKGFTLVELLVVIAILAVLATVSVVGYTSFIDRANQSTALQEMTQIRDSVIAEDILNPNFSISGGTITVADGTDPSYPNFNEYVKSLTDALGEGRSCDNLETGEAALVLKNTDKKVKATWTFADNTIETDKLGNDEPVAPPAGGGDEGGAAACEHTNTTTTTTATCEEDGTKTVHCDDCNTDISTEADSAKGHSFGDDGECANCDENNRAVWELVTDASQLADGKHIIIVASGYNLALGKTQNENNRAEVAITKGDGVVEFTDGVQVITLEDGSEAGTYLFKVDGGYLYAASSTKNWLKTSSSKTENSNWKITIGSNSATTIVAQGSSTNNQLQYNSQSTGLVFSCYSTTQKPVNVYVNTNDNYSYTAGDDIVEGGNAGEEPETPVTPTVDTYKKITSADEFTSGTYVIVVNGYAMNEYSSGWVTVETVTVSGDTINSNDVSTWTVTVSGSSVILTDANGNTIAPKSGNTNGITTGSYSWDWSCNNGVFTFKGTGSDTTTLASNKTSSYQIRAYKNATVSGSATGYPSEFEVYRLVTE